MNDQNDLAFTRSRLKSSVRKKTRQRQPTNTMDFLNKAKELDKKHDLQAKAKVGMGEFIICNWHNCNLTVH